MPNLRALSYHSYTEGVNSLKVKTWSGNKRGNIENLQVTEDATVFLAPPGIDLVGDMNSGMSFSDKKGKYDNSEPKMEPTEMLFSENNSSAQMPNENLKHLAETMKNRRSIYAASKKPSIVIINPAGDTINPDKKSGSNFLSVPMENDKSKGLQRSPTIPSKPPLSPRSYTRSPTMPVHEEHYNYPEVFSNNSYTDHTDSNAYSTMTDGDIDYLNPNSFYDLNGERNYNMYLQEGSSQPFPPYSETYYTKLAEQTDRRKSHHIPSYL